MGKRKAISSKQDKAKPPDAELEVLACLWRRGKMTARGVRETMDGYRPMTHGAMVTLLKRLEARGLASHEKGPVGKAFLYSATDQAGPTYRRVLRDMRHRIFGGSGVSMIANLLDAERMSTQELDEVQKMFDEMRRRADGGTGQ